MLAQRDNDGIVPFYFFLCASEDFWSWTLRKSLFSTSPHFSSSIFSLHHYSPSRPFFPASSAFPFLPLFPLSLPHFRSALPTLLPLNPYHPTNIPLPSEPQTQNRHPHQRRRSNPRLPLNNHLPIPHRKHPPNKSNGYNLGMQNYRKRNVETEGGYVWVSFPFLSSLFLFYFLPPPRGTLPPLSFVSPNSPSF